MDSANDFGDVAHRTFRSARRMMASRRQWRSAPALLNRTRMAAFSSGLRFAWHGSASARMCQPDDTGPGETNVSLTKSYSSMVAASLATASAGMLGLLASAGPALAQSPALQASLFSGYASVCQSVGGGEIDCEYGTGGASWTAGSSAVSSSVSHGWQAIYPDSPNYNYGVGSSAQTALRGPRGWTGSTTVGGYINSAGFQTHAITATSQISSWEGMVLPSTPTWQGPGYMELDYRITGAVGISYGVGGANDGGTGGAESRLAISCFAGNGAGVGSICQSPDFAPPPAGSTQLGSIDFAVSQTVDRTVRLQVPVYADTPFVYGLGMTLSSRLHIAPMLGHTMIIGTADADLSHTIELVGSRLYDSTWQPVDNWTAIASSGFNYADVQAVPEPSAWALLGAGLLVLCARRTRPSDLYRPTGRNAQRSVEPQTHSC
ncbi:MAG: PEP-CTERM sorting domain-containing protein [Rubrivivax sp.]|nr:MAG: PEP-CTERM sorting domain-containing protein [Rubrivivax sp.]